MQETAGRQAGGLVPEHYSRKNHGKRQIECQEWGKDGSKDWS